MRVCARAPGAIVPAALVHTRIRLPAPPHAHAKHTPPDTRHPILLHPPRMLTQASSAAAASAARRPSLASTSHRGGAALRAVVARRPGRAHARRAPVAAQANELNKW